MATAVVSARLAGSCSRLRIWAFWAGVELADAGGRGVATGVADDPGFGIGGGAEEAEDVLGEDQRRQAGMTARWITAW